MELFIQIRNGQPYEHPIFGDNFRQAFPDVDVNNLPHEFARFNRVACPQAAGIFEVDEVSYQWLDGVVTDVWTVRPMTPDEEAIKRQELGGMAERDLESRKEFAQRSADTAITEQAKQAWLDYLAELNAWVLVDPVNPNIPKPPRITTDGTVLTTTASGSAPDVIG